MKLLSSKVGLLGGGPTFWCPGCQQLHRILVDGVSEAGPRWQWNGDAERPTITPSILVQGVVPLTDAELDAYERGEPLPQPVPRVCHVFVTDGRIQFLGDCTHSLAGQTVPMPDLPEYCRDNS